MPPLCQSGLWKWRHADLGLINILYLPNTRLSSHKLPNHTVTCVSILDFALFITVHDPDTCYWTTPWNKRTARETSATGVLLTCFNSLTFFTFDELISLLVRTMCASASSSRDVLATYLQLPADIQTLPASRTKRPRRLCCCKSDCARSRVAFIVQTVQWMSDAWRSASSA